MWINRKFDSQNCVLIYRRSDKGLAKKTVDYDANYVDLLLNNKHTQQRRNILYIIYRYINATTNDETTNDVNYNNDNNIVEEDEEELHESDDNDVDHDDDDDSNDAVADTMNDDDRSWQCTDATSTSHPTTTVSHQHYARHASRRAHTVTTTATTTAMIKLTDGDLLTIRQREFRFTRGTTTAVRSTRFFQPTLC